jgi:hypothetical protein
MHVAYLAGDSGAGLPASAQHKYMFRCVVHISMMDQWIERINALYAQFFI